MGSRREVVSLDRVRLERLAREIADQVQDGEGHVIREVSDIVDVEEWRKAARRAGRLLGVPIRTGVAPGGDRVWAVDNS
jgi:hypothetical protein